MSYILSGAITFLLMIAAFDLGQQRILSGLEPDCWLMECERQSGFECEWRAKE